MWVNPELAAKDDPAFSIQGEYFTQDGAKDTWGAQVVALGNRQFEADLLEGGLPGKGWSPDGKKTKLSGKIEGQEVILRDESKSLEARIRNGVMSVKGHKTPLKRIERQSPTLGSKPPQGAVVLFDGSSADAWAGGKLVDGKFLGAGCTSKQQFASCHVHLEFRTPYKPDARGQKRGNSGVYYQGRWETQVLDSFGLPARDNHCGGIYSIAKPSLNAGLPPLVWQTYDVDFTAATFGADGKRTAWPRITVRLNGVLIHDKVELNKDFTTSAPIHGPLKNPKGPIYLQDHHNPVVYRNIWVVPH